MRFTHWLMFLSWRSAWLLFAGWQAPSLANGEAASREAEAVLLGVNVSVGVLFGRLPAFWSRDCPAPRVPVKENRGDREGVAGAAAALLSYPDRRTNTRR
jgi:hypothetical protein